jgi:hypothetical protein
VNEQLMGWIFFANPEGSYDLDAVDAAAKDSGIPEKLVHAIRPRSAFIRAARELAKIDDVKSDFRTRIRDDDEALTFAFVLQQDGETADRVDFKTEALVKFHKKSQWVEVLEAPPGVDHAEITRQAQAFYKHATRTWTCADVNNLVKRFVARQARQIGLRAGVSFLPYQADASIKSLTAFYKSLGVSFYSLPVGHSEDNAANLTKAVAAHLRKEMDDLTKEIKELETAGKLTGRMGQSRLEELQTALSQYQDLAKAVQVDMGKLIANAGDAAQVMAYVQHPIDALISMAQDGTKLPEVLCSLYKGDDRGAELTALIQAQQVDAPLPALGDVGSVSVVEVEPEMPLIGGE